MSRAASTAKLQMGTRRRRRTLTPLAPPLEILPVRRARLVARVAMAVVTAGHCQPGLAAVARRSRPRHALPIGSVWEEGLVAVFRGAERTPLSTSTAVGFNLELWKPPYLKPLLSELDFPT